MHIHIGYDDPNEETNIEIVKMLDLHLSVPGVLLDGDTMRRELYGKAGCYRHKKYGVEYRTLSNFWLSGPNLINWVATATFMALGKMNAGQKVSFDLELIIQDIINNNDIAGATTIVDDYNLLMPKDTELPKNLKLIYYNDIPVREPAGVTSES